VAIFLIALTKSTAHTADMEKAQGGENILGKIKRDLESENISFLTIAKN
jgi:hypothetical protein